MNVRIRVALWINQSLNLYRLYMAPHPKYPKDSAPEHRKRGVARVKSTSTAMDSLHSKGCHIEGVEVRNGVGQPLRSFERGKQ